MCYTGMREPLSCQAGAGLPADVHQRAESIGQIGGRENIRMFKKVDKICERCWEMMHMVSPQRQYCDACRMAKNRERSAQHYAAHKKDTELLEQRRKRAREYALDKESEDLFTPEELKRIEWSKNINKTLAAKTVAARKMGMSYGQYSAWLRMQREGR